MYDRFSDPDHINWAREVKERDLFTCQICDASEVYLHSHHMNSWDFFVEERFDIDNGVTLCEECHEKFHAIYGHGRNTKYQYEEFKSFTRILQKMADEEIKKELKYE